MRIRNLLWLAAAAVIAATSAQAQTANWPTRNVKLIVPLGPGSGVDITARLFAERLSTRWSQSVVVENRPGGDGVVAITSFVGANDDHTLFFGPTSTFTSHPYLMDKLPYDPKDLSPIAKVSSTLVAIAVPGSLDVKTLKELLEKVKADPGKLNWAGATGTNNFLFEGYLKQNNLNMAKVPYRDTVQAINDLAEGRIQAYIGAYAIVRPQLQSGRVKLVAMTNTQRAAAAPDVPTAAEAGFPALGFDGLTGFFGPQNMPANVREKIAADARAVAADPEVVARLTATGQVVSAGTSAEFVKSLDEQRDQVAKLGQALGIKPATQ